MMKKNIVLTEEKIRSLIRESIHRILNESNGTMTVFHGSPEQFEEFSMSDSKWKNGNVLGKGIYTTTNPQEAKGYGRQRGQVGNGFVYELSIPKYDGKNYISWNSPLSLSQAMPIIKKLMPYLAKRKELKTYIRDVYDEIRSNGFTYESLLNSLAYTFGMKNTMFLNHIMRGLGYYGITHQSRKGTWFIVFYPQDVQMIGKHTVDENGNLLINK